MMSIYHAGELAVQARAGVQAEAEHLRKGIGGIIKPAAQEFLQTQQLAIASTIDERDRVWASLLTGELGFVQPLSEKTVEISAKLNPYDPIRNNLQLHYDIGLLVIDLATRRRLRLNGKAEIKLGGKILVYIQQVYFNCPKYIQRRRLRVNAVPVSSVPKVNRVMELTSEQQQWIAQADTFFIASFHPKSGADASHRGGNPGFVRILNASKLVFPDYAGNNMFNTFGNLFVNPQAGLLFIDFEQGNTLQLTGEAHIIWDTDRIAEFAGAERIVEFEIEQVLELRHASPLRWQFIDYSPYNPT